MKAVVWHGQGEISLDEVDDPRIVEPTDAIVRIITSAICGTDLHMVRGTMSGMRDGTILGHEGVGVVEEVGADVRGFSRGDRVVVCSTIACGVCNYCRAGYFAQCNNANPNGPDAGTSFFGGPEATGPVDGLQAAYARIPYAATTLVKVPDAVTDEQAIMVSDVLPTGWFGARLAQVAAGDTVLVIGAGIVGQCAIASAKRQGATRVLVIDGIESRLAVARAQNAETIDFNAEDPIEVVKHLTGGSGADRVIDAVGVDAHQPKGGPAVEALPVEPQRFDEERRLAAPETNPSGGTWVPGDAPSLALRWGVQAAAKAGTLGIIGVYAPGFDAFPIGEMMNKNLTVQAGLQPPPVRAAPAGPGRTGLHRPGRLRQQPRSTHRRRRGLSALRSTRGRLAQNCARCLIFVAGHRSATTRTVSSFGSAGSGSAMPASSPVRR